MGTPCSVGGSREWRDWRGDHRRSRDRGLTGQIDPQRPLAGADMFDAVCPLFRTLASARENRPSWVVSAPARNPRGEPDHPTFAGQLAATIDALAPNKPGRNRRVRSAARL